MNPIDGVGRILWEARERKGLSRREVAELCRSEAHYDVSEATISNIETAVSKKPYPRTLFAIAEVLGLDSDSLFKRDVPA